MKNALSLEETREMLKSVARGMVASRDLLTQADRAIGDGDHGVGMERGFEAVLSRLESAPAVDLKELFEAAGMTLITTIGGAAGIVFGTWLRGGGRALAGCSELDASGFADWLNQGMTAVMERGKAKPGDKTMLDALAPACQAAMESRTNSLLAAVKAAAAAAKKGVENTKGMVATVGKARALGERSLGHADPGAISTQIILDLMAQYIEKVPE